MSETAEQPGKINYALKVAAMESDIKTVITVFGRILKSFGIDEKILNSSQDITSMLPSIVGKLSQQMMMGTFDSAAFAEFGAIMPILEKYKYLSDQVIQDEQRRD